MIPSLALWFDAADATTITLSAGTVSEWRDKSSNAYSVFQPNASYRPNYTTNLLNGLPGVQLSGTRYLYQLGSNMPNFSSSPATTVYMVAKNGSTLAPLGWNFLNTMTFIGPLPGTPRYFFSFYEENIHRLSLYTNDVLAGFNSSYVVPLNSNAIVGFAASATSNYLFFNGSNTAFTSAGAPPSANDETWFFFGDDNSNYVTDENIYEFVGFNTVLTTAQQQAVEGYLATKWGLQSSLSNGHPFKTTPLPFEPTLGRYPPYPTSAVNNPQFDPRIFSGCILWLDGADPLATGTPPTSGTNITTWYDKSYSSNNFTMTPSGTTPAQAFLDGSYPTVSWTSNYTNGMVSASSVTLSANSSIFVVWKSTNATLLHDLLQLGSNTTTDFGLRVNWVGQASGTPNFTVTNSNDAFYNNVTNSSTVFYLNGTSRVNNTYSVLSSYNVANGYLNTASTAFTTPTNIVIGYTTAFTGRNYSGYIGEIILYQTAITETQRQQVEAYLANKWGINRNLSSTNRYAPGSYLTFVNAPRIPALPMRRAVQTNKFLPSQYSNCVLWLDAADVNGTGRNPATGTITSWTDKSGSGNSSTGSGGTPTLTANSLNGKPGVAFSGTSYIQVPRVVTSDWSIFIVFSTTQTGPNSTPTPGPGQAHTDSLDNHWWAGQGIFDGEVAAAVNDMGISLCGSPTGYLGYGVGDLASGTDTTEFSATPVNTGAGFIGEFFRTQSSGNLQMFVNGAFQVSTTGSTANRISPTLKIGSIQTLPAGYYFTGNVYEIVCYSRVLSTNERQQIEGYFAWKWGLKASLGLGHPFFLIPPLPLP